MAARRLLIVMLILLGLSTLAAALVPPRATEDGTTTTTEEEQIVPDATAPTGELLDPVRIAAAPPPELIPITAGDQLPLTVTSRKADLVEIPGLGLLEPVAPLEPARFDLLIEEPGSYGVRLITADRVVVRIEVREPGAKKKPRSPAHPESGQA